MATYTETAWQLTVLATVGLIDGNISYIPMLVHQTELHMHIPQIYGEKF